MFTISPSMVFIGDRKECNRHVSLTRVSRIEGHSTMHCALPTGQEECNITLYSWLQDKQTLDTNPNLCTCIHYILYTHDMGPGWASAIKVSARSKLLVLNYQTDAIQIAAIVAKFKSFIVCSLQIVQPKKYLNAS